MHELNFTSTLMNDPLICNRYLTESFDVSDIRNDATDLISRAIGLTNLEFQSFPPQIRVPSPYTCCSSFPPVGEPLLN